MATNVTQTATNAREAMKMALLLLDVGAGFTEFCVVVAAVVGAAEN